ncbi:MAG: DUF2188 domain-containing protein [Dysgonamonadaceae bacterium]|jgi:hypothetical protein|nr:DUF2188 domain-containing protein [Dysgonamonadaceae bacterium]
MSKIGEKNVAYYVVSRDSDWVVKKSTATRAAKVFKTQEEAIVFGTLTSQIHSVPLYIHI